MRYTEILSSMTGSGSHWTAQVPDTWAQGRTVFGGLQAAIALRAMRALVPAALLRSLQITFIAPVPPGTVEAEAKVLRSGKSATQVEARISDGAQLACLAVAVFGTARESAVQVSIPQPAVSRAVAELKAAPYVPDEVPAFLQHAEMRWASGPYPYSGSQETRAQIFARFPGETAADDYAALMVADTIPPLGLGLLTRRAPGSSMTWALDFVGHDFTPSDGFWLLDAELSSATGGYLSQTLTLWSPQMRPIALSRQAMVIFA